MKQHLHEALLQFESYEKSVIYRKDEKQAQEIRVDNTNFCTPNRKLPPILFLQMDNCVADNKNRMFLHFYPF